LAFERSGVATCSWLLPLLAAVPVGFADRAIVIAKRKVAAKDANHIFSFDSCLFAKFAANFFSACGNLRQCFVG
jgi:hypothetical protein